jgi:signal transduction histidine kinase
MAEKADELKEWLVPLRPPEECRILIVDDEPSVVEIISFFLDKQGYQTFSAANGREALDLVRQDKPDVVVMDVNMPEMDGVEACRRIKKSPKTHFLPVILVTAKGDTSTRIQGKDAGADDYLDKPVNELELTTRVRTLLRGALLYEQVEASNRELEQRVVERTVELREAYERLKALERAKSDIITNVSHELRTPLQHIRSSVALLTSGGLPQTQTDILRDTVDSAVESLVYLVEDMINLGDGNTLRIADVMMPHIVKQAVSQCRAAHTNRADNILIQMEDDLPPIHGDARALTRVIYHLLDNALKFSEEGSQVVVSAERTPDDNVRVTVQDHGIGITVGQREQVFEAFFQVDRSSTRRYQGIGLGLALVQLILEGHGVEAHLESEEEQGTTIWFEMQAVDLD